MSKYTTEVRFICEQYAGLSESAGFDDVDTIISNSMSKIFDFSYPIFDESYRKTLQAKILRHFYTREIGAETVGLWKLWLCDRLNMIMPYYNQLYKSELLTFNPLYDVDYSISKKDMVSNSGDDSLTGNRVDGSTKKDESSREYNRSLDSSNKSSDETTTMSSDTPQGGLDNITSEMKYLSNIDKSNGSSSGSGTQTIKDTDKTTLNESGSKTSNNTETRKRTFLSTDEYLETVKGKRGGVSNSKLLAEYRQTFLNIDSEVINSLNDLFMGLW